MDESRTQRILTAPGYWWRDDPSRFPRTTWHAVKQGEYAGACGFAPVGFRRTENTMHRIACPSCVALVHPTLVTELHFDHDGTLLPASGGAVAVAPATRAENPTQAQRRGTP